MRHHLPRSTHLEASSLAASLAATTVGCFSLNTAGNLLHKNFADTLGHSKGAGTVLRRGRCYHANTPTLTNHLRACTPESAAQTMKPALGL